MKTVEYRGFGSRTITAEDWESLGIKSKEVKASQGELIEVNDQAAAWLMENEPADWRELSEREADERKAKKKEPSAEEPTTEETG